MAQPLKASLPLGSLHLFSVSDAFSDEKRAGGRAGGSSAALTPPVCGVKPQVLLLIPKFGKQLV